MAASQNVNNIAPYPKFLMMKSDDPNIDITTMNLFIAEKALVGILGQDHQCAVKSLRSGHLLIEVDQKRKADMLLNIKQFDTVTVIVEPHKELNTSKGIVYCEQLSNMSDEEILKELKAQNPIVTEVYRIKRKEGATLVDTNSFILTFNTTTLPEYIKIGYMRTKVKIYIPNPRRCFNCQQNGHGKNKCNGKTICARCGQEGHEYCQEQAKCCHCLQPHDTTSKECPKYKLEKKVMEEKVKNNITMYEARKKVYNSCHDLVRQLPGNSNKTPKTWSEVTASGSSTKTQSKEVTDHEARLQRIEKCLESIVTILTSLSPSLFTTTGLSQTDETTNEETEMDSQDLPDIQPNERKPKRNIAALDEGASPVAINLSKKLSSSGQGIKTVPASSSPPGQSAKDGSKTNDAPPDPSVKEGAKPPSSSSSKVASAHSSKGGRGGAPSRSSSKPKIDMITAPRKPSFK